ncbi:hypothetical protein ACFXKC_11890 [Streptomyces sp. NPDC059340]|uniref:hypothetical protein n=1 Tax=unclassified Streptomyces TaxID=2593676 RepID=UPI0033C1FCD5
MSTTIWLSGPHDTKPSPVAPSVLPAWAIDKIRTEFTHRPGRPHAPLLRLTSATPNPAWTPAPPAPW